MEGVYQDYPYALYFITLFFVILQNHKNENNISSNIIILYLIFCLTNIFNIMGFWYNTIIISLLCFVELEIIDITEKSEDLVINSRYKFLDFLFKMIVKYKYIYVLALNIFMCFSSFIYNKSNIIGILYVLICGYLWFKIVTKIYKNDFSVISIDRFNHIFNEKLAGFGNIWQYGYDYHVKMKLLTSIEDKSFFYRINSFTFLSLDSLLYKISNENNELLESRNFDNYNFSYKLKYIFKNLVRLISLASKIIYTLLKACFSYNGIYKYIKRGYSTIEMQLMRNLAIENGYSKVYTRKIFELIYTNIYFKSMYNRRKNYEWSENMYSFKMKIIYCYLLTVKTFIEYSEGMFVTKDLIQFHKLVNDQSNFNFTSDNIIRYVSKEELFVFVIELSRRTITPNLLYKYRDLIDELGMDRALIIHISNKVKNRIGR